MKVFFDIITNHTADVIGYEEGARTAYVSKDVSPYRTASGRVFDDRDYAGSSRFPDARPGDVVPLHAGARPGRGGPQGPGLAQRPDDVPQPRQHDVHRRGQPVRRLLRPRRPLHRAARGRRRDDRHLPELDRRVRHRRLPDRHDEARQRRVLAGVRARDPRLRRPPREARLLHVRRGGARRQRRGREELHVALHDARRDAGDPRLPVPGRRPRVRLQEPADPAARGLLRRTTTGTPTPTPTRTRCRPSSATTTWAGSATSSRPTTAPRTVLDRRRRRAARARPARPRADVPLAWQPGRLLRRRAGLHRHRRRPARAADDVREPGAGVPGRHPDRHRPHRRRRQLRHRPPALPGDRRPRGRSPIGTPRCATAPSRSGSRPTRPACSRSRGSTASGSASTSSCSTTASRPRPAPSRRTSARAASRGSTAPVPRTSRRTATASSP